MRHRPLIRIFMNGGVLAPTDLAWVLDASEAAGNAYVHFSSRQDILFPASGKGVRASVAVLREAGLPFAPTSLDRLRDPRARRNVVSSYPSVSVTDTTWWLTEDVYQYTLASLGEQPRVAVHLVDPAQSLVPLFGGHVHFVASSREHYWHLYLRGGDRPDGVSRRPGLFHGDDLPRVVRALEERLLAEPGAPLSELMAQVPPGSWVADAEAAEELPARGARFPCYEGFNPMPNGRLWLGLYWRNNRFDIPFLRAACDLCRDTRIGKISLTPWKSFLIKDIRPADRVRWEELMGAFGINTRHSSLELNWHIPVLDDDALELKNEIVSVLTMRDISTHGLTFTIRSGGDAPPFTTVVVERMGPERYAIRHARDFDPLAHGYVSFVDGIGREAIPSWLIDLSKLYWSGARVADVPTGRAEPAEKPHELEATVAGHQCTTCLTVYDERYGDVVGGIEPGVPFGALPDGYACPVCSAGREAFAPVIA